MAASLDEVCYDQAKCFTGGRLSLSPIRRKRVRAVALATAMMVCVFLLVLTGALVQTQNGVFAVAQSSDARVRARAACQSLYDYCLYQIEHDRSWGAAGFPTVATVDPNRPDPGGTVTLPSRVEIREVDGRKFRGYLSEHGTSFEVEVINGLTSPGTISVGGLSTPPQHVRFSIAAWEGKDPNGAGGSRSRQQVDCLLRLAPLFDASVLSRGNVKMEANEVVFASKDRFRNEIRSEGTMTLPGLTTGFTVFVENSEEVTRENSDISRMRKDRAGLLWAGEEITNADGSALDNTQLAQAARASGGRMVDNATNRADIYDLKPENIPQPAFAANRDIVVPPGEFRFTIAMATTRYRVQTTDAEGHTQTTEATRQEPIDVVEYYDPPNSPKPLKAMRAKVPPLAAGEELIGTDIAYAGDLADVPVVTGDRFALDSNFQDSDTVKDSDGIETQVPEMGFRNLEKGASSPVILDLSSRTVTVLPETRVKPKSRPDGSSLEPAAFELTVKAGPGGEPGPPYFKLGNGTNDVVIEADGDISIGTGYTDGLATFISKEGSVTLNPRAQSLRWKEIYINGVPTWVLENEIEVQDNPSYSGLVIYAEKDVNITNISDADWGVRGFVYARRDFNFNVNNHNATFYGSVIAGNDPNNPGAFNILGGDRATFIYDPDYLKLLTKGLPYNWTRVEPLLWTEANG